MAFVQAITVNDTSDLAVDRDYMAVDSPGRLWLSIDLDDYGCRLTWSTAGFCMYGI